MASTQRCLDSVHLTDTELDCLVESDVCRCLPDAACLGRAEPGRAPTRGNICHLIKSLHRRWRRWNARDLTQKSHFMLLWTRLCFRRLYGLDVDDRIFFPSSLTQFAQITDHQIGSVILDADAYHELLNHQSRGVRRVFCRIPYVLDGADNTSPTPELEKAMEKQRLARHNIWNEAFDRDEGRHMGPFSELKFSLDPELLKLCQREPCPLCSRNVYLYCTSCHAWAVSNIKQLPRVILPINVVIIAKKKEWAKKCTAVHSCIVSPGHCSMIEFPSQMSVISALDPVTTLILYPNETAFDMASEEALPVLTGLRNLIVVDSTCAGARQIMRDSRLLGLPSVSLKSRHTTFWKFTNHGPAFLGTIEAIYYFMVDYFVRTTGTSYDGRYDDLLLLYVHQLRRVETSLVKKPLAWQN